MLEALGVMGLRVMEDDDVRDRRVTKVVGMELQRSMKYF